MIHLKNCSKRELLSKLTTKRDILSNLGHFNEEERVSLTNLEAISRCFKKKTVILKFNLKVL